jgi:hypothetical protein
MGGSQSQKAGEGSTLIQAGGNVQITLGVSYADLDCRINAARREIAQDVLLRAEEMLRVAGLQPGPMALKTIVPLLQHASLEENGDLQERWASLLANACRNQEAVLPSFAQILHQLSAPEAKFLDAVYQYVFKRQCLDAESVPSPTAIDAASKTDIGNWQELLGIFVGVGLTTHTLEQLIAPAGRHDPIVNAEHNLYKLCRDNLVRSHLLRRNSREFGSEPPSLYEHDHFSLTALGIHFVSACKRPRGADSE